MVDSDTIETKISDKKEEFEEEVEEEKEEFDAEETFEEKDEKTRNVADNFINELYRSVDDIKDSIRNMQKNADKRYQDYKKTTVQSLDIDMVETKETYYIKVAVPGATKKDVLIEAGDNDITIECTFTPYIEEFDAEEEEELESIVSAIKSGRCVKTIRFENSIDIENITAKFKNGIVIITIPKLIIPKHKVKVE